MGGITPALYSLVKPNPGAFTLWVRLVWVGVNAGRALSCGLNNRGLVHLGEMLPEHHEVNSWADYFGCEPHPHYWTHHGRIDDVNKKGAFMALWLWRYYTPLTSLILPVQKQKTSHGRLSLTPVLFASPTSERKWINERTDKWMDGMDWYFIHFYNYHVQALLQCSLCFHCFSFLGLKLHLSYACLLFLCLSTHNSHTWFYLTVSFYG